MATVIVAPGSKWVNTVNAERGGVYCGQPVLHDEGRVHHSLDFPNAEAARVRGQVQACFRDVLAAMRGVPIQPLSSLSPTPQLLLVDHV